MLGDWVNRKVDPCKRYIDVRISKTCERVSRPANKLYPIEDKENKKTGRQKLRAVVKPWNRPRKEEAVIGDIKRRFVAGECKSSSFVF